MSETESESGSIAIVGAAGRFPGADDVHQFWNNLVAGRESLRTFTDEELKASGIAESIYRQPDYVRVRATLEKPEWFDAAFFGFTPREAELTDPQHRVFLECAWTALEDAALDPAQFEGAIGIWAGASLNTYLLDNIGSHREQISDFVTKFQADGYPLLLGNDKDYLATRVAYKFDLRGPAITVQTACSTSLVAVVQAVNALLSYQCDAALAGGVSISFPQERGYQYQEDAIASADGHTRAFDANARGTVFGSGCGVVVLKRLQDAIADGDHVYAVIRGAAVNNDGHDKVSYVAPSVNGQAEVVALAHALAEVPADTIDYVEAHGTGTPLGDPIEVSALTQAFRASTEKTGYCLLGTAKTNVGHMECAAGVAGLIKTAFALEHGVIPPSLNFSTPNPRIDFASSPFRVVTELTKWTRGGHPRRAGVSSFGIGGTNAHVVVEEAPQVSAEPESDAPQLLVLSARTLRALEDSTERLVNHLKANPGLSMADVAYTLQVGRRAFEFRRFVVASSVAEAARLLRRRDPRRVFSTKPAPRVTSASDELTALGLRWLQGETVDWSSLHSAGRRRRVPLPTYPFQRQRFWIEPQRDAQPAVTQPEAPALPNTSEPQPVELAPASPVDPLSALKEVLADISGADLSAATEATTLLDLGFDSLFLTQIAVTLQKRFGVKLRFRQLMEELSSLGALADYCSKGTGQQKQSTPAPAQSANAKAAAPASEQVAAPSTGKPAAFGPFRPAQVDATATFTTEQQAHLDALTERYIRKTAESKRRTQANRRHFADPRSVSGFRPYWKEIVYPIITVRSAGARFWDVDGNEYIDLTMGFGTNLLGHAPSFITAAIEDQLKKGIEVGPQSPLAGEVAELLCELTGHERAAFCNTGSEAVLAAIRIARTVTGRTRIATTGGFHGICDEVLVRANVVNGVRRSVPVAPGIPEHVVRDVLVLDYGSPESLDLLRGNAHDLAALLIEPVQSRHPDLQPRDFLHAARQITAESETALIFDEVINGFRCHLNGAQAHFGVKSDIGTWGKVIGGGLPIGAVTGSAQYMDALDGGHWQYGDASFPEVGVTFFAGTYVRHPLAMAASKAILQYLKEQGPGLQQRLNERTTAFVTELNQWLHACAVPLHLEHFASLFYLHFEPEVKFGSLLYFHLRDKGLHIWEGRPCFLSTAHTDADVAEVIRIFKESVIEMVRVGFLPGIIIDEAVVDSTPVALSSPAIRTDISHSPVRTAEVSDAPKPLDFSIYFFGNYPPQYREDKYRIIFEAAKWADANGFKAIWLPERHFHAVGGFSPNPSVLAAAIARETRSLQLRAGSVVLPLHHPIRVAEEWAVVDNLSDGRVGMSIASGWHPNDFVFAPDAFDDRRQLCFDSLETINRLWHGETVEFGTPGGGQFPVRLHPMPKQKELPVWLTCIHKDSFVKAGELGVGVLGYLMNQTLEEVADKIAAYREGLVQAGHHPSKGHVTILLHTFVGQDLGATRAIARGPLREYLRSFLDNSQKRIETQGGEVSLDAGDMEYLLDRAFEDYAKGKALIGSPESCVEVAAHLRSLGVDEIGCFVDFGISAETVLEHLPALGELKDRCSSIEPVRRELPPKRVAASNWQRGLWAIGQLGGESARAYNEATTLQLSGELNLPALQKALQTLVNRHEALRTFMAEDGESLIIHRQLEAELHCEDLSGLADSEQGERVQASFRALERTVFDLTKEPGFRAHLLTLRPDRHLLVLVFHHLFGNGPAYWVFFEELVACYGAIAAGRPVELPKALQLTHQLSWQANRVRTADYQADEAYWLEALSGELPKLELPTDLPRPAVRQFRGGRKSLVIDQTLTRALRECGARNRGSLFMVLFAACKVLLGRLSGQTDVIVGVPADSAVRELDGGDRLFANTTNMMPLRAKLDLGGSFADLIGKTKSQVVDGAEHQEYFFGELLPKLGVTYDSSRAALFSVSFNLESGKFSQEAAGLRFDLLTSEVPYRNPRDVAQFDLLLNVADNDGVLTVECDFDADLFEPSTIERWLRHYRTLLQSVANNSEQPIGELALLDDQERSEIIHRWNDTTVPVEFQPVHRLIAAQAEQTPTAIAAEFQGQTLTYAELNQRASDVAAHLQSLGVTKGALIGICLERSLDMLAAVLGVLKAGAAYVPLDPMFPRARLEMMVEDAALGVIIAQEETATLLPGGASIVLMKQVPQGGVINDAESHRDDLAYVLFTSGSTGRPKGVEIPHGALTNFLLSMQYRPGIASSDRLLAVTTLSFDIAGLELFLPLIAGARVVIAPYEVAADGLQLGEVMDAAGATVMQATPATWRALLAAGWKGKKDLRVFVGGESVPADLVAELLSRSAEVWNLYGPTETTIWSTVEQLTSAEAPILSGRQIANTQAYILNEQLQLEPIGVVGELYLSGDGLARGYRNQPELTAERFIANPFSGGGTRMYRTGDLARFRPDGRIECLGRVDHQIKLRGFRIEKGEIESVLRKHPMVANAVVTVQRGASGEDRLVAFYTTGADGEPAESVLRRYLADQLPAYMVPSSFQRLAELPLTPNGKIDLKQLPQVGAGRDGADDVVLPNTELERELVALWEELLERKPIGVTDSFFDLGGHSLLAVRLLSRVTQRWNVRVSMLQLFNAPTVSGLAGLIKAAPEGSRSAVATGIPLVRRQRRTEPLLSSESN